MPEAGVLISLNVLLLALLSARLRIRRCGWASPGALTVFTAITPHYILRPLYLLSRPESTEPTELFIRGLALCSVALAGTVIGAVIAKHPECPTLEQKMGLPGPQLGVMIAAGASCAILAVHFFARGTTSIIALASSARLAENRRIYLDYELSYLFMPLEAAGYYGLGVC